MLGMFMNNINYEASPLHYCKSFELKEDCTKYLLPEYSELTAITQLNERFTLDFHGQFFRFTFLKEKHICFL